LAVDADFRTRRERSKIETRRNESPPRRKGAGQQAAMGLTDGTDKNRAIFIREIWENRGQIFSINERTLPHTKVAPAKSTEEIKPERV
jgi:hypothetical protein